MKNNPRGSTWKKCDFHFHTPLSFDHNYKSQTPKETVDKFREEGVSLVAITDHYFIDPEYIQALRDESAGDITFLPGVEFRSDVGDKAVHMIGIFSEEKDLERLSNELSALTKIYKADLDDKHKLERIYTKHQQIIDFINENDGLLSIHAGCGRSGSFETVGNDDWCLRTFKTEFLRSNVNLLDITKDEHERDYKTVVFPATGLCHPLITGSDNHDIRKYKLKFPCWLNCDATFQGLLQVINEPEERVFLGECPPPVLRTQNSPTNYIKLIKVDKKPESRLHAKWFESCSIPINSGLVSIIGNKGNGKSALSDIIALLCNSHQDESSYSFLNKKKFRHKKNGKAGHFHAQMEWLSGEGVGPLDLNIEADTLEPERARYIPQRYLEELCNEHDGKERFQQELQKVIYSHIPEEERLESGNLEALIGYVTNETQDGILEVKQRLSKVNKNIAKLEQEISDANQTRLKNDFDLKFSEYKELLSRKPVAVAKPSEDPDQQKAVSALSKKIEKVVEERDVLAKQNDENKKKLLQSKRDLAKLKRLEERLTNLQQQFETFKVESPEFEELGLKIDEIVTFRIDHQLMNARIAAENKKGQLLKQSTDDSVADSIANKLATKVKEQQVLTSKLSEPERIYQKHLNDIIEWKKQLKKLAGDTNTPDSLRFINHKRKELENIPSKLEQLANKRQAISKEIFAKKQALKEKYEFYYAPVHSFIKNHPLAQKHEFKLEFTVSITDQECSDRLLSMIDQGRAGSFYGKEAGRTKLEDLIIKKDFNDEHQVISFAEEVVDLLKNDVRNNVPQDDIDSQLVKGLTSSDVYNYIFGFDYLQPIYNLSWAGKELDQLSPGERGNLLLIFYLLIDQEKAPLILDQPEDNLDNHTVYKTLVPCIRDAKRRRQIIMVTHNPNLAVVCDSDQIIHAEIRKEKDSEVIFTTGAIENPEINERVIDVLEGTRPAFDKRDSKYIS